MADEQLLSRWAVDREYTKLVQAGVAAGRRPSEVAETAREWIEAKFRKEHPGMEVPRYIRRLGDPDQEEVM